MRGLWCQRIAVAIAVAATWGGVAAAQSDPSIRSDIDRAFNQLFNSPGDPGLTYGYAQLQIRAGNYEAAVAAYERLLLQQPNQPRLLVELGVLYIRMGSYQVARGYLQRARALPNLTPDLVSTIDRYLGEADRRASPSQFSGSLTAGIRYQTNPRLVSQAGQIFSAGVLIPNPERRRGDFSAVVLGRLNHVYDFQTNDRTAWVSSIFIYGNRYFRSSDVNLMLAELNTGPRFRIFNESMPGSTFRPYVLGMLAGLDDRFYLGSGGGGFEVSLLFNERFVFDFSYQGRYNDYQNTPTRGTASLLTGLENSGRARFGYQIDQDTLFFVELAGRYVDARARFNDFGEFGATVTLIRDYASPFGWTTRPWSATASAGFFRRNYGGADPVVSTVTRRESEWRLGVANVIPLSDTLELVQQVDGLIIDGNLPNYDRRDLSVIFGVRIRF